VNKNEKEPLQTKLEHDQAEYGEDRLMKIFEFILELEI